MISGFFGQYDRPFVEATVISEEIELEANVLFLIDTGADVTCLHYPDIDDMGVDQRLVVEHGKEVHFGGIGGLAKYHAVDATIKFEKSLGEAVAYEVKLNIADEFQAEILEKGKRRGMDTRPPSLLGRDVWGQMALIVNLPEKEIRMIPRPQSEPR